jgi:hydantoinase/carbamoylase family amidase
MFMVMPQVHINKQRLHEDFDALANIGATRQGGVSRVALSNDDLAARSWFAQRIEEAGLTMRDDEVGNLSGVLYSANPNAQTLLVGSHLDTTPNGGKYDGSVGILAGLECLRCIQEMNIELPFHLEVIDFTDEEGVWQSLFGSMGLTGTLTEAHINDSKMDNAPFRAALFRAGLMPSEIRSAKRDPRSVCGYLELHIEQGDYLDRTQTQIGVVTRIVGRSSFKIKFHGEAVHAATNYAKKRDALQGAAHFITQVHSLPYDYEGGMVNCGTIEVKPDAITIVPSLAKIRMEVRHAYSEVLHEMEQRVVEIANECAERFNLRVETERILHREVAHMDKRFCQCIEDVCNENNLSHTRLFSLAGHDAQILAPFTPSAMIFIPCKDGISMNPKEFTDWQNVENGATVLLQTILKLASSY